ncbi:hypothetical protein BDF19DRAFT_421180 [Syncephalis fuscata]|nr:hypothetical protein BDF19DRAFT_421180 [Syncephalis fuscata]
MALKATLEQWDQATQAYDQQDYNTALDLFEPIADSAKIHFNIGVILSAAGDHESAIKSYISALYLDQYFAIAYFQKGVSNAKLGDWEAAFDDFNDALLYLRGNLFIDYKQLGLDYKLYSCEVLFNRGVCYMQLEEDDMGRKDFETARQEKQLADHARVDLAISRGWETQPIFKLPRGKLFRPDESKLKNSKKVDYLGKAKLIASHDVQDTETGFSGTAERKATSEKTTAPIPRSNALQSTLDGPTADIRNRPAGHGLSRNNTHIGNMSVRTATNDVLSTNVLGEGMQRRPSTGGPANRLRPPNSNPPNQRPVSPRWQRITVLFRQLLDAKKSYEGYLQHSPDGSSVGSFATTNLATGNAAKLSRSDSRSHALALARQNSFDRRSPNTNGKGEQSHSPTTRSPASSQGSLPIRRQMSHREPMTSPPMPRNNSIKTTNGTKPGHHKNDSGQWNNTAAAANIPAGKIKLKCHYKDDTRYLMVDSDVDFSELRMRVTDKFSGRRLMQLKYKDEDNELVQVSDNEDLDIARGNFGDSNNVVNRMELWCFD